MRRIQGRPAACRAQSVAMPTVTEPFSARDATTEPLLSRRVHVMENGYVIHVSYTNTHVHVHVHVYILNATVL